MAIAQAGAPTALAPDECACGNRRPVGFISCERCAERGGGAWLESYREFVRSKGNGKGVEA